MFESEFFKGMLCFVLFFLYYFYCSCRTCCFAGFTVYAFFWCYHYAYFLLFPIHLFLSHFEYSHGTDIYALFASCAELFIYYWSWHSFTNGILLCLKEYKFYIPIVRGFGSLWFLMEGAVYVDLFSFWC